MMCDDTSVVGWGVIYIYIYFFCSVHLFPFNRGWEIHGRTQDFCLPSKCVSDELPRPYIYIYIYIYVCVCVCARAGKNAAIIERQGCIMYPWLFNIYGCSDEEGKSGDGEEGVTFPEEGK